MKKLIVVLALSAAFVSCNKTTEAKDFKTGYVDIVELMDKSTEAKDIEAKFKGKADEMGSQLKVEATKLDNEKKSFQTDAQKNGQQWAQQKYGELQQREQQLQYAQQGMLQQLQGESGKEMDSLMTKYKKSFKEFGKEKGYDYIYGTGEVSTILYAKEVTNLTKDMVTLVNDMYKKEDKAEVKTEEKEAAKK
ncbi:MAG: outer membrane protein [Flavobacterium sp.]|jgi:outer membrane protein